MPDVTAQIQCGWSREVESGIRRFLILAEPCGQLPRSLASSVRKVDYPAGLLAEDWQQIHVKITLTLVENRCRVAGVEAGRPCGRRLYSVFLYFSQDIFQLALPCD